MAYRWNGIECDTIEELRQLRNQNIVMPSLTDKDKPTKLVKTTKLIKRDIPYNCPSCHKSMEVCNETPNGFGGYGCGPVGNTD